MTRQLGVLLFFSIFLMGSLHAQPVRIVTENFAPYNYEEAGEAKGFSSEVLQAVLNQINLKATIEFYPWARAYEIAVSYTHLTLPTKRIV